MFAAGVTCGAARELVTVEIGAIGLIDVDTMGEWYAVLTAGMETQHRTQVGSLHLVRATHLWCTTEVSVQVKMTENLLSIRVPADIRDPDVRD